MAQGHRQAGQRCRSTAIAPQDSTAPVFPHGIVVEGPGQLCDQMRVLDISVFPSGLTRLGSSLLKCQVPAQPLPPAAPQSAELPGSDLFTLSGGPTSTMGPPSLSSEMTTNTLSSEALYTGSVSEHDSWQNRESEA